MTPKGPEVHILSLVEVLPWPGLGLLSGAQLNCLHAEFQIHRPEAVPGFSRADWRLHTGCKLHSTLRVSYLDLKHMVFWPRV